jgi:hypothetical protein
MAAYYRIVTNVLIGVTNIQTFVAVLEYALNANSDTEYEGMMCYNLP